MTKHREILRLDSIGLSRSKIAESCQCSRTTVTNVLQRAERYGLRYPLPEEMTDKMLARNFIKVRYVRLPELLVDLAIARSDGTYRKVINQYKKPPRSDPK